MYPSYLNLYKNGQLKKRTDAAFKLLESCCLCPRKCGVNRTKKKEGFCQTGNLARVYSYMPHFGEEPPISGNRGSGTIFFSHCNMACVYCQNYEFSQSNKGREVDSEELARYMLELQGLGCHNINLVTPTHVMPQILEALSLAISRGLKLPIVYNTGGYELPEIIGLLEDIIDIYLPDMRYADSELSRIYSNAPAYPEYNQAAIKQMHKQVGDATIDEDGVIKRGLIIRHLVLPDNISGTKRIMRFVAQEVSTLTYISLMSQYWPQYKAHEFTRLSRRLSQQEYNQAKKEVKQFGLFNGWLQESGGLVRLAGRNIKPR